MTIDEIKSIFPEFNGLSDDYIARHITEAETQVSKKVYGEEKYRIAILFLTAHLIECSKKITSGIQFPGILQSKSAGGLSWTYHVPAYETIDTFYTKTEYGTRFLSIKNSVIGGGFLLL